MKFTYRGQTYTLPTQLKDITLDKWIEYKETYNHVFEVEVTADPVSGPMPGLEECVFISVFAGIPLDEVKQSICLSDVFSFAGTALHLLFEEERAIQPALEVEHSGKTWQVKPPVENPEILNYAGFQQYQRLVRALRNFSQKDDYSALVRIVHSFLRNAEEPHPFVAQIEEEDVFKPVAQMPLDQAFGVIRFISDSAVVAGYLSRNPIPAP